MKNLSMTIVKTALLSAAASAALALPAFASENVAIINTKVVTNTTGGTISGATILIQDGKIVAIGQTDTSENAPKANGSTILDGSDLWVTPGIFAPFSRIGLSEISLEATTNDQDADEGRNNAGLRASDSFNPKSTIVPVTRAEGVTHAAISNNTGNSVFGGLGAIIDTSGEFDSVIKDQAFIFAKLGEGGSREAGGSRAAAMNEIRNALRDGARRYSAPDSGDALSRSDAAALTPVLSGASPFIIEANRASDIRSALSLKSDAKNLNIVILGGAEAWMVAEEIKAAGASVLIDPTESLPASFDSLGTRLDNAARLKAAGIRYAFMSRTSDFSHNPRLLPQHAGNAVANGLSWDDAFKAITLTPAQIFGQSKLGQLRVGSEANLVVWDGDPLEVMSAPVRIVIDGNRQSLESRQSALASRYNPNNPDKRAHKYRR